MTCRIAYYDNTTNIELIKNYIYIAKINLRFLFWTFYRGFIGFINKVPLANTTGITGDQRVCRET